MNYEDAEFCKIAINQTLISQVENTNFLSMMAARCGADWMRVAQALRHDSRIGKFSYLTPGDWKKSKHLLRDHVTLNEMSK
jgi:UDP-glucose 6-dehydrogenase